VRDCMLTAVPRQKSGLHYGEARCPDSVFTNPGSSMGYLAWPSVRGTTQKEKLYRQPLRSETL
jgi:hypothetical protein